MNLSLAMIAWVAGSTQFALTFQQVSRVNPDAKIPMFWGRPQHHPGEIYVYRGVALFLLLSAGLAWGEVLGVWSTLLIVVGTIPTAILNVRHNRRVQARSPQS